MNVSITCLLLAAAYFFSFVTSQLPPGLEPGLSSPDEFKIGFERDTYEFIEGSSDSNNICLEVTGTRRNSVSVTVFINSHSATADESDYEPLHNYSVIIGQAHPCFNINITDDRIVEEDEALILSLAKPPGSLFKVDENSTTAIVLIKNDDRNLDCRSYLRFINHKLFTHCIPCNHLKWTGWDPVLNSEVPVPMKKCDTGKAHLRCRVRAADEENCVEKRETILACTLTNSKRLVLALNLGISSQNNQREQKRGQPPNISPGSLGQSGPTGSRGQSGPTGSRAQVGRPGIAGISASIAHLAPADPLRSTSMHQNCRPTLVCENINTTRKGEVSSTCSGRDCHHKCKDRSIVFLLDTSGSVGLLNFNRTISVLSNLIPLMCGNIHVAFMTFSSTLQMEFCFNCYNQSTLKDQISRISYRGGLTHTGEAIRCLHDNILSREGFCQMNDSTDCLDIIVVTDGRSNGPLHYPQSCHEMNRIKNNWCGRVNVHAIGIGFSNIGELKCLTNSFDSIFSVKDIDSLEDLFERVYTELSNPQNNYYCVKPACPYEPIKL